MFKMQRIVLFFEFYDFISIETCYDCGRNIVCAFAFCFVFQSLYMYKYNKIMKCMVEMVDVRFAIAYKLKNYATLRG